MKAVLSAVVAFCAGIVFAAESPVLRLAVLSDLQGYPYPEDSGMRNLERALDVLAPFKPDVVLTVGDINDGGCDVGAVRYYKGRCDARLGVVPHVACLGNHEIGFVPKELQAERTPALCIADFNAVFGAGPSRLVHKVIGGYDFIAISIRRTSGFLPEDMPLLKGALDKAVARDAKKPVFVLTHYHPYDTVNGSDSKEADGGLRALLDGYPQVVNLSGHTHNPLQDPRSIWQGTFTVLETSTLCYGCLDEHPPMSNQISCLIPYGHESIGCLLLEVFADRLVVRRFAVREGRELEPDRPWSFALPYDPKKPTYDFASRAAAAPTPRFPQAVEPTLWYDFGFVYILFNSVENKDDTYAYRIELTESGGEMKSYWHLSDFYRAPSLRVPRICSRILPNTVRAGGSYHCRIVPVGFFGTEGRACEWNFTIRANYPVSDKSANVMQE